MISFSGIDCSGKSTQINLVCGLLESKGKEYEVVWSRGGYTPGMEFIKKLIRRGRSESREKIIEESNHINENRTKRKILFIAGLIDLWAYYSIALRFKGMRKVVICDRYIWDTYIDYKLKYPEYDFEHGFWWRLTLRTMVKPKPSFCLTIPADVSMYRSTLKDEPFPETIEVRKERIDWYVHELKNNRWDYEVDATKSVDEVFQLIKEKVK